MMMFFVNWVYALVNIVAVFIVWFYIGRANPGVAPGVAADFRFLVWMKECISALCGYVLISRLLVSILMLSIIFEWELRLQT